MFEPAVGNQLLDSRLQRRCLAKVLSGAMGIPLLQRELTLLDQLLGRGTGAIRRRCAIR